MLLMRLESIEHARFRASAQIIIDKDKGVEAFEDYMKIAFPYLDALKRRDRGEFLKALNKEVARGAITVTPVMPTRIKSKLKTRMVQRSKPQTREEADRLYQRLNAELVPRAPR